MEVIMGIYIRNTSVRRGMLFSSFEEFWKQHFVYAKLNQLATYRPCRSTYISGLNDKLTLKHSSGSATISVDFLYSTEVVEVDIGEHLKGHQSINIENEDLIHPLSKQDQELYFINLLSKYIKELNKVGFNNDYPRGYVLFLTLRLRDHHLIHTILNQSKHKSISEHILPELKLAKTPNNSGLSQAYRTIDRALYRIWNNNMAAPEMFGVYLGTKDSILFNMINVFFLSPAYPRRWKKILLNQICYKDLSFDILIAKETAIYLMRSGLVNYSDFVFHSLLNSNVYDENINQERYHRVFDLNIKNSELLWRTIHLYRRIIKKIYGAGTASHFSYVREVDHDTEPYVNAVDSILEKLDTLDFPFVINRSRKIKMKGVLNERSTHLKSKFKQLL